MTPIKPRDDSLCSNSKSGSVARSRLGIEKHPVQDCMITWWGPYLPSHDEDTENFYGPAYGNVTFLIPVEFIRSLMEEKSYNIYFIENIQYSTIFACRFLITTKKLDLKRYDPSNPKEGPWKWMSHDSKSPWRLITQKVHFRRLDLEFMLELKEDGDDSNQWSILKSLQWGILPCWPSKRKSKVSPLYHWVPGYSEHQNKKHKYEAVSYTHLRAHET